MSRRWTIGTSSFAKALSDGLPFPANLVESVLIERTDIDDARPI